jgi:hypothetical protein
MIMGAKLIKFPENFQARGCDYVDFEILLFLFYV